jgi:Uma2 family endonuclease
MTVLTTDQPGEARRAHRWTVEEYERMGAVGLLPGGRTELIDGVVVDVSPQNPPHALCVERLTAALYRRLLDRARVRVQAPVRLATHWMPEPDVALVRIDAPADRHPQPDDLLLVVEVSDTSLADDRGEKLAQYARSGVSVVWIVDLNGRCVEVHAALGGGRYGDVRVHRSGEDVDVPGFAGVAITVDEVIGTPSPSG